MVPWLPCKPWPMALSGSTFTPNADYVVIASKKGYLNNKAKESTRGLTQSKDFEVSIALTSTEKTDRDT